MGDFFRTGMIAVADFRQGGMAAWSQERLKILVKMRASWWAHALSTLPGTLSYWTGTVPGVRCWDLLADIVVRCSEWSGGTSWGWEQGWSTVLLLWYFKEAIYLLCQRHTQVFCFHSTASVVYDAHTSRVLLLDRWDSMLLLWSVSAFLIPLLRSAQAAPCRALYRALACYPPLV